MIGVPPLRQPKNIQAIERYNWPHIASAAYRHRITKVVEVISNW